MRLCVAKNSVEGSENKQLVSAILCLSSCVWKEVREVGDDACAFYSVRRKRVRTRGDQRSPNVVKFTKNANREDCERTRRKRGEVASRLLEVRGVPHQVYSSTFPPTLLPWIDPEIIAQLEKSRNTKHRRKVLVFIFGK